MSTTTDETPQNPWTETKFIVRATVLAVVVLAGVLGSVFFLARDTVAVDTTVPACERPIVDDTDVYGRIPVTAYQAYGAALVPITPYGPDTTTPAPSCFEHSPGGASAAAASAVTLLSAGRTDLMLDHLAVDNRNARDLRAEAPGPASPLPVVAATRVDDYTGDAATIRVALEDPEDEVGTSLALMDMDMVWDDGWKWEIPAGLDLETGYATNGYNSFITPQEDTTNG